MNWTKAMATGGYPKPREMLRPVRGDGCWVRKGPLWFDFVWGWHSWRPNPMALVCAEIVVQENPGARIVRFELLPGGKP